MADEPVARLRFPRAARVRLRGEIRRAYDRGIRVTNALLVLWGVENGLPFSRIGLIVSRRHGEAVRRNRIRRVLREAYRLSRAALPVGVDYLCAPQPGARIELAACRESLERLAAQIARRLSRRAARDAAQERP